MTAIAESARRAANRPARGGVPNVLWVVSAVEAWPAQGGDIAALVTVRYPWGSLLRGALGRDPDALASLARMLGRGGRLDVTFALTDRDGVAPPTDEELERSYAEAGLELIAHRPATADEIAATATTWARRLGVGASAPSGRRPVRIAAVRR